MIIFGWRTRESTTGSGTFTCPHCRTSQVYRHVTYRRWFTLYFLPVIPLGRLGEQLECQGCLRCFAPQVLDLPADEEPIVAALADDASGTRSASASPWAPQQVPGSPGTAAWKPGSTPWPLEPARTSALAITSLICGLLSPLFLLACNLSLLTSLAAVITGHLARWEIKKSGGRVGGNGQAITGLISGYLLLAVSASVLFFFVASFRQGWEQAKESRMEGPGSSLEGPEGRPPTRHPTVCATPS